MLDVDGIMGWISCSSGMTVGSVGNVLRVLELEIAGWH